MAAPDRAPAEASGVMPPALETDAVDKAPLGLLAARDVALGTALLSLFAGADAWRIVSETALAGALSIVSGLVAGFGVAALAHEWAHYAGARRSGARTSLKAVSALGQIFDYDYARNTPAQFDKMSVWGNLGHFAAVVFFSFALPLSTPGQVAVLGGAVGQAVFASSIEFPVIRKARDGMPPAEALATIPEDFLRRSGGMGLVAALIVLIVF